MKRWMIAVAVLLAAGVAVGQQWVSHEVPGVPLTELKDKYKGCEGALYPGGKNERPAAHEAAGLALAREVVPRDAQGQPAADGKIVLLSIGMSNTTQEYQAFMRLARRDEQINPRLVLVDGAQGGMAALQIVDPEDGRTGTRFWGTVDERLKAAGVTRAQVQAAWVKQADIRPTEAFPKHAEVLEKELEKIVGVLHERFANLKLAYVSSRIYAGYARTQLNPEPYAFEGGYAVKWLVEKQIKGEAGLNYDAAKGAVKASWLSWGPYLWGAGETKRADGLVWKEEDFGRDGTHPSDAGREKVGKMLLEFFKADTTAKGWFLK